MSIREMTRVWEDSKHKGSNLLCLLAIADTANDWGLAWPGYQYLAKKTRLSAKQVSRIVDALEASTELYIDRREGRTHQYLVMVGLEMPERMQRIERLMKRNTAIERKRTPDKMSRVEGTKCPGGSGHSYVSPTPDIAMSDDPSFNHHINHKKKESESTAFDHWQTTQGELRLQLPRETYDTWLRNARLLSFDEASATFTVGVHNVYAREWLEHRLKKVVLRTLRRVADNEDAQVSFEVQGRG